MTFTQIPQQYAPLGGELCYTVAKTGGGVLDLRIKDAQNGTLMGVKRLTATAQTSVDVAPYLRRAVHFTPSTGETKLDLDTTRTLQILVEAAAISASGVATDETILSSERTFLPSQSAIAAPGLLTTMPLARLLSPDESDELTLLCNGVCTVTVTAQTPEGLTAENYRSPGNGLWLFRISAADFPGAEMLTVDAGACGTVTYTIVRPICGSRRLAWRSSAGSIEHYTFPIEKSVTIQVAKGPAYGPDGHTSAGGAVERQVMLSSAYQTPAVTETLTEILCSPQVWLVADESYTPVDVLTHTAVLHHLGELNCLEIAIRDKQKIQMPWN